MSYNNLRKGRFSESNREYLVTAVSAQRRPIFKDFWSARILIDVMRSSESRHHCQWLAWVIMPDHFHGLLLLQDGHDPSLSKVMQFIKGKSARAINQHRQRSGAVWQPCFHDHALRRDEDRRGIARYIIANPVRAGLVSSVSDWPHWDCVWLNENALSG